MNAIATVTMNTGTAKEIFFYSMPPKNHALTAPLNGDFLVDDQFVFEIGGRKKSFNQIKSQQKAYVASDNIEIRLQSKIPFGCLGFYISLDIQLFSNYDQ